MLGNPDNYRMLGQYTMALGNCALMKNECARVGLTSQETSHFFGCATGVFGRKPT